MRILGHGIDITPVDRIARMLAEHGERFTHRVYTDGERAECAGERRSAERLAARFAAKEAALKALGTGLRGGIAWTDISVVTLPSGQPTLRVAGRAAEVAKELGIADWRVSLTHTAELAMASVLALGP